MTANKLGRRAAAVVVSAAALFGIAWLSAAPVPLAGARSARLRLSWSARPERIEKCRTLSDEELEKLEIHMRQRVECEGRFASYSLHVSLDGQRAHESVVRGAGLRNDRPIYLLEDLDIEPGIRRVRVSFNRREENDDDDDDAVTQARDPRADTGLYAGREEREGVERIRRARAAIRPRLELDTTLAFESGRVIIVTLDPERGALKVLSGAPRSR